MRGVNLSLDSWEDSVEVKDRQSIPFSYDRIKSKEMLN